MNIESERAAFETWYETTYGISLEPEFRANHFIGYVNDKANHRWTAWQARAALSAPSHGEQVLVPRSIAQRMATDAAQYDHEHAIVNDNVQLWQQKNARLSLTVGDLRAVRALLSAPSAGSQGGDV